MMCLLMRKACAFYMDGSTYPSVSGLIMCNGWGEQGGAGTYVCVSGGIAVCG